jgi:hypothetical protein
VIDAIDGCLCEFEPLEVGTDGVVIGRAFVSFPVRRKAPGKLGACVFEGEAFSDVAKRPGWDRR